MIGGLLEYISTHTGEIMTGLTMTLLGIGIYEARDGFFLFRGSFRGKFAALAVFLAALITVSLFTPVVGRFWEASLPEIMPGQLLGLILIMGMLSVNKIAEWNYGDPKSLLMYAVGGICIHSPELVTGIL